MIFNRGLYDSMTEESFRSLPVASVFIALFFKFFLHLCYVMFAIKKKKLKLKLIKQILKVRPVKISASS